MEYNNAGNRGCLIGNWIEERDLLEASEEARKNILSHGVKEPVHKFSVTQQVLREGRPRAKRDPRSHSSGPRQSLLEARFLEEAQREEEAKQEERYQKTIAPPDFRSTSGFIYGQRDDMRPIQYEQKSDRESHASLDFACPISVYTQRLVEGSFFVTPVTNSNPFARNTGFSNEVHAADKYHLNAEDGNDHSLKMIIGRSTKAANGAHLVQRQLLKRVQDYLHTSVISPNRVHEIVAAHVSSHRVTETQVCLILRKLNVPLTDRECLSLADFCLGQYPDELVCALLGQQDDSTNSTRGPESPHLSSKDATFYKAIVVRAKSPTQEAVEFGVPRKLLAQPLSFPQDIPVVKAILRKQGIVAARVLSLTSLS